MSNVMRCVREEQLELAKKMYSRILELLKELDNDAESEEDGAASQANRRD